MRATRMRPTRVAISLDAIAAIRFEDDMRVRRIGRRCEVRVAKRALGRLGGVHDVTPAHAEMRDEHLTRIKLGQQILGAAIELGDACAFEPLPETQRQRKAQIAAARLDAA